jgi:hypothetical protein
LIIVDGTGPEAGSRIREVGGVAPAGLFYVSGAASCLLSAGKLLTWTVLEITVARSPK